MTEPDPDKLRIRWAETQFQEDEPDEPDWRDDWVDTLDYYNR